MINLDCIAQRLLITSLKTQIGFLESQVNSGKLDENEIADLQNDIGYAYTLLSDLESSFFLEFKFDAE